MGGTHLKIILGFVKISQVTLVVAGVVKGKGKGFPILDTERWARS